MEENQTPQTNPTPPAAAPAAPATASATGVRYAGFWIRFVAAIIDIVVVGVVTRPLSILTPSVNSGSLYSGSSAYTGTAFFVNLITWAITIAYGALMISSSWQATLGKKALGLKVTDVNGNRLTPGKAFLREGSKIISGLIIGIGYIMAAFDAKKQSLHDKIAATLVVRG